MPSNIFATTAICRASSYFISLTEPGFSWWVLVSSSVGICDKVRSPLCPNPVEGDRILFELMIIIR
ncbi:hypothetical protein [Nostoc sp.]|uniref:hypothetical protein n=1 Tax=Nostoc sp. TaxID=1180 RepID=UPI002FFCD917